MKIGFQGAAGAYSETAAQRAWPGSETVGFDRFEDVFEAVASGRTSHGLLPVENSIGRRPCDVRPEATASKTSSKRSNPTASEPGHARCAAVSLYAPAAP